MRTRRLFFALLAVMCALCVRAEERMLLNLGWKHAFGEQKDAEAPAFDDAKWTAVDLPHDASIYGEFLQKGESRSARNGFRPMRQGWYRRHLAWDAAWQGKRVVIEFEAVYRDAQVFVNGKRCDGMFPNGYVDFELDITDKLHEGDNVIAIYYDNRYDKSSRWYNGEGINRDVWLKIWNPVHVARYGTYITTPKITPERAVVAIETSVVNETADSVLCRLITDIVDPQGKTVASRTAVVPFKSGETYTFRQEISVANPQLWNVGDGKLYQAVSRVYVDNAKYDGRREKLSGRQQTATPSDTYETNFGIREIEFSPETGLSVNGKRVYINGVNLHTDLGPLGTASFADGWDRRLDAVVNKLGCNGIRLSHNCYPKYVLDWADRHGVLVVDEFFDKWEDSYYGKGAKMGDLHLRDVHTQMMRDRNHPSVFLWSVGNEVYQQIRKDYTRKNGVEMLKMLVSEARSIDPTRKVTVSQYPNRYGSLTKKRDGKRFYNSEPHQFEFYTDIVSTNYLENFWDEDHRRYPQLIFMEGEMAVGDLGYDYFNYDHSYPVGHFYWGGTDYIGESFGWPAKGWVRGLIDFTNRLKPLGKSVKSFYAAEPMAEIVARPRRGQGSLVWNDLKMTWTPLEDHWNYKVGDTLDVQVMTNCDETELFLNGKSLGRKQLPPKTQAPELVWKDIAYAAGTLRAVGYNKGVKVVEDVLNTAGKPARLVVDCDAKTLRADGMNLAYLNYTVLDKDGNICPTPVKLTFSVKGQGRNAGVASSDMRSDEPWQADCRTTADGCAQLIVRSSGVPGEVVIIAKAKGLKTVKTVIPVR